MIEHNLDKNTAVLYIKPTAALSQNDFDKVASEVDPFIQEHGGLRGVLLEVDKFPGWEDFPAAIHHFRFVKDHHKQVEKVALVTDSSLAYIAEHVVDHFVSAEVKHFASGEVEKAIAWLLVNISKMLS
ncbi:MAG: STAS/SEC14 domain-containing protein [Gammaproteobacteria bacterium]|nr:STAS/SEC14 domain-containing protein [Gammaproteobacteria bacterium]